MKRTCFDQQLREEASGVFNTPIVSLYRNLRNEPGIRSAYYSGLVNSARYTNSITHTRIPRFLPGNGINYTPVEFTPGISLVSSVYSFPERNSSISSTLILKINQSVTSKTIFINK